MSARRGIQVLEVLLLFPVLLIATFSFFVLGPTVTIRQNVQHAAGEAAREVAKKTGTQTTDNLATDTVDQVLSVHGLDLLTPGVRVDVWEYDAIDDKVDHTALGDTTAMTGVPTPLDIPVFSDPNQVIVQVTVEVGSTPIPNVLSNMKFDLSGRYVVHRATAFRDP
ncbi:TadE family protein [Bremerella sp. JC770]|uniref:TadE/TadG family type IV pilus assembly protein n=1 Tax=Bremerella sp. JC770 TaxID=3232137 RepID=UPI003458FD6F